MLRICLCLRICVFTRLSSESALISARTTCLINYHPSQQIHTQYIYNNMLKVLPIASTAIQAHGDQWEPYQDNGGCDYFA